jgi:PAS domain S-box-containing protein
MTVAIDPRLYQLMADQVQDYAIFLLDVTGKIVSWNAGAATIKQYSAAEVIGRHFSVFYTPSDVERGWPDFELNRAKTEGRFEDEGWRVRKDGSRFWANVVITALRDHDGTLLAFSKITRDLTARKSGEEALRESEERFRLLVDGVQDYAIYLLNPDGVVISWNSGARRIKGYEASDIIGSHFSRFYAASDIDAGKPWIELALARQDGRAEDEGWRIRKDGSRFWARVVVTALYDSDGTLRGYAKVTQDLTKQRHTQALEASAREINDFIAILAHELRNPLAPIRHAAQLIEMAGADEAARRMALGVIERQSAQLARIVDDLLDVSRITRGMLSIRTERVSMATIISRALETVRPAAEAASHTLVVDLPSEAIYVDADELRLTQAVVNILGNAVRYTDVGGTISIGAHSTGPEAPASAVVEISDNGRGIDPEYLQLIFSMFVQGKDPLNRGASGLGVGLALARGIVELHHGTVTAFSEGIGKGAKFIIRMPMAEASTRPKATAPRAASRFHAPRRRVLVVDDNVDAASVLESLLKGHGHEVTAVHNGIDALAAFDLMRPEVVLLDIGMPGMSGLEVARRMRERNRTPSPLIVAVTGWGKMDDEVRSREAGFDLHLVKPVLEAELLEVLDKR